MSRANPVLLSTMFVPLHQNQIQQNYSEPETLAPPVPFCCTTFHTSIISRAAFKDFAMLWQPINLAPPSAALVGQLSRALCPNGSRNLLHTINQALKDEGNPQLAPHLYQLRVYIDQPSEPSQVRYFMHALDTQGERNWYEVMKPHFDLFVWGANKDPEQYGPVGRMLHRVAFHGVVCPQHQVGYELLRYATSQEVKQDWNEKPVPTVDPDYTNSFLSSPSSSDSCEALMYGIRHTWSQNPVFAEEEEESMFIKAEDND